MLERRAAIAAEMRSLNDTSAGENGDLSAEQRGRWDTLKGDLDGLQQRIDRQATIDDTDRRMQGQPLGGADRDDDGVGLLDAIRAQMGATDAGAQRAIAKSKEAEQRSGRKAQGLFWNMEKRVVTTTTPAGGPGGALIPTDYRPELFIDRLRNTTRVRGLGATVLTGLSGNMVIPRRKASVVAGWVAENTALPTSDPQFDGVTLAPKHAGVITEWSRNMILQASPDVEQLCRQDMALVLAEMLDAAAIAGTGTNNQPLGILNTPGIGVVPMGANGGVVTYDALADLVGLVDDANATGGSMALLTNTKVRRSVAKIKDTAGNPLGLPVVFQAANTAFSNIVPGNLAKGTGSNLSAVIYGNWSDLLIGVWSELDILVNPYESSAYSKGNVSIRAMMTVDVAVRHPESFAAIKDAVA